MTVLERGPSPKVARKTPTAISRITMLCGGSTQRHVVHRSIAVDGGVCYLVDHATHQIDYSRPLCPVAYTTVRGWPGLRSGRAVVTDDGYAIPQDTWRRRLGLSLPPMQGSAIVEGAGILDRGVQS